MIRPFIPSEDYKLSKQFYLDLGFEILYEDDSVTLFQLEDNEFYLQNYYEKTFAENVMNVIPYNELEELQEHVIHLAKKYVIKVSEIVTQNYGDVFYIHGPSGELWHFVRFI